MSRRNILNAEEDIESFSCDCIIKTVMIEAENKMRDLLKEKSLKWLYDNVYNKLSYSKREAIENGTLIKNKIV